jgi:hypothetical protein
MDPFDNENHEKKKNTHDPFRDDDIFRDIFNDNRIKDIFNDDKVMDDIKKMAEEMMKTTKKRKTHMIPSETMISSGISLMITG